MNCVGLDIGTSSICLCVVNCDSGEIIETHTFDNDFNVEGREYERKQNAGAIVEKCISEVDSLIEKHSPVCCIGITGQMHGIVYVDKNCNPVSDLFTWQDMTGSQLFCNNMTFAEKLSGLSGYKTASGYGATTYFCHKLKNEVPGNAAYICTIHDLVAAKLAGLTKPVMHSSDAHSFGLYSIEKQSFDKQAIENSGLDYSFFPDVVNDAVVIGKHGSIPVCVAVGDNQASFIGSVRDTSSDVLINFGTGSQISFMTEQKYAGDVDNAEIRPFHRNNNLFVGSALCGGRAFSLLEKFIRSVLNLTDNKCENAYPFIDRMLKSSAEPDNPLKVCTTFAGTRGNPDQKGSIENIDTENFTAEHLIYGVLRGMSGELAGIYNQSYHGKRAFIVGSGNGLRKNNALQRIICDEFNLKMKIPLHTEEAAFGACLYAMTAAGMFSSLNEAQKLIKYI